jgi:alpha,alpha-trehalase
MPAAVSAASENLQSLAEEKSSSYRRIKRLLARGEGPLGFLRRHPDSNKQGVSATVREIQQQLEPVAEYISNTWWKLIRTHEHLYLGATYDEKVPNCKPLLYISAKEDEARVCAELETARHNLVTLLREVNALREKGYLYNFIVSCLEDDFDKSIARAIIEKNIRSEADLPAIEIRRLPPMGEPFDLADDEHGLLYVPKPYIVPGPRFDEMYNWDTAFLVSGLLQDEKFELSKDLVDNFLYQIEHYGTITNGTRTYYYDTYKPRSQPPLLTGTIVGVFLNYHRLTDPEPANAAEWLERAATLSEAYHRHWMTPPHYHAESGLSMFSSHLPTPGYEVIHSEPRHYSEALRQLQAMYEEHAATLAEMATIRDATALDDYICALPYQTRKDLYYLERFTVRDESGRPIGLNDDFYKGDRAMRETGFDPSRRFGFFNVNVLNYLPVCLSSLRVKMEDDIAWMYGQLEQLVPERISEWLEKQAYWRGMADRTQSLINEWLWDEGTKPHDSVGKKTGPLPPCYRDRNISHALCSKYHIPAFRDYDFITSLYPLWVGVASGEQADATVRYLIPRLKTSWGIMTSSRETGSQWDRPMMWAPLVIIAVEALERYDYYQEAFDIAVGFLRTLIQDFSLTGKLYEKYNGLTGTSGTSHLIDKGYSANVEGFGWTNSVALELSRAIERLKYKMRNEAVPADLDMPVTTTVVRTEGLSRPGKTLTA